MTDADRARPALARAPAPHAAGAMVSGLRIGLLFGPSIYGVTAASIALPRVVDGLAVAPEAASWVLTVHALMLGVAVALFGRMASARGVRAALTVGAPLLLAGTALILTASTLGMLVAGRAALACGSGAMMASALTIAAATDSRIRVRVLGWFGVAIAIFAGSATLAGGVVTELVGWRLTLVLPVLSLIGALAALPLVPRHGATRVPMDLLGATQLALAAGAVLVLIQAPVLDLDPSILVAVAAVGIVAAVGLTLRVRSFPTGFVPRVLATDALLGRAALTGAGVFCGLFGAMYAIPQLLAADHGWSELTIGWALMPGALAGALLSRAAGRRATRLDGRTLLGVASIAFAATLVACGLAGGPPMLLIAAVASGLAAFALTQVVVTDQVARHLGPDVRGTGVGLLNLAFMTGGAVGTAAAGALSQSLGPTAALALIAVAPMTTAALVARPDGGRAVVR